MALAGINKKTLAGFGGEAHCFMAEEKAARLEKERKTTRAAVSMEMEAAICNAILYELGR